MNVRDFSFRLSLLICFGLGKFLHSLEVSLITWRRKVYTRWTKRSWPTQQLYDSITQLTIPDDIVKMTLALDPILRNWVPLARSSFQGAKLATRLEKGKWKLCCCWQRATYCSHPRDPRSSQTKHTIPVTGKPIFT